MSMKVYLSGKITGRNNWERDFERAEVMIRDLMPDAVVLNPKILPAGLEYEKYMQIDFAMLAICDLMVLLPGWDTSNGVMQEIELANYLGIKIKKLEEICNG